MTTNLNTQTNRKSNAWIGGAILVAFGALALIGNFTNLPGHLFLFAPGLIFLAWGLIARHIGPVIPGGILTGAATGVYLISYPSAALSDTALGAAMMLPLAGGFFLIALLSLYTERGRLAWWPLIPGSMIAVSGGLMLGGETGLKVLEIAGMAWPVVLVVCGASLILRRK
jgi:hypothetical protein